MRARWAPALARASPSPLRLTGDLLQFENDPPRVGAAGQLRRLYSPFAPRGGQFVRHMLAFEEQADGVWADKALRQRQKLVERRAGTRRHKIDRMGLCCLDAGIDDLDRRIRDPGGLPQKHGFALVALDQFD